MVVEGVAWKTKSRDRVNDWEEAILAPKTGPVNQSGKLENCADSEGEKKTELGRGGVRGPYMKGMAPCCVGCENRFRSRGPFSHFFSPVGIKPLSHTRPIPGYPASKYSTREAPGLSRVSCSVTKSIPPSYRWDQTLTDNGATPFFFTVPEGPE